MAPNERVKDYLPPGTSGWIELQNLLLQIQALPVVAEGNLSTNDSKQLSLIRERLDNITRSPQTFIPHPGWKRFLHHLLIGRFPSEKPEITDASPRDQTTGSPPGPKPHPGRFCRLIATLFGVDGHSYDPANHLPGHSEGATWADLYEAQRIRLRYLPNEYLVLELAELKAQFLLYSGPTLWEQYQDTTPPRYQVDDEGVVSSTPNLKAEATFLLEQIQHIQSYRPHQERRRLTISWNILMVTFLLTACIWTLGWCLFLAPGIHAFPLGICLILSLGAFGAAFSSLQRLQRSVREGRTILISTRYMRHYRDWIAPPVTGAVFAFLACLLFMGGFFEKLSPAADSVRSDPRPQGIPFLKDLAKGTLSEANLIRVLILSFIAGFAERWVPDTLDRLAVGITPKKADTKLEK
jgi:hypothetical protein